MGNWGNIILIKKTFSDKELYLSSEEDIDIYSGSTALYRNKYDHTTRIKQKRKRRFAEFYPKEYQWLNDNEIQWGIAKVTAQTPDSDANDIWTPIRVFNLLYIEFSLNFHSMSEALEFKLLFGTSND